MHITAAAAAVSLCCVPPAAGTWQGKTVAVKIMQLPASTGLLPGSTLATRCRAANSPPNMAIMEAVLSSAMSHPNVIQVYTYMLRPMLVGEGTQSGWGPDAADDAAARGPELVGMHSPVGDAPADAADAGDPNGPNEKVLGWELRLVMEFASEGTLRDALDKREQLIMVLGRWLPLSIVLSLVQDVAAAMLHLHNLGER